MLQQYTSSAHLQPPPTSRSVFLQQSDRESRKEMGDAVTTAVQLSGKDVAPVTIGKRQTGLAPAATERLREPRHDGDERAAPREREHVIGMGAVRGDRLVIALRLGVQGALDE